MSSTILHAGTYLVPSIPVEFFVTILDYIETKLGYTTTLLYEPRHHAPRIDVQDPFASGYLDIGIYLYINIFYVGCKKPINVFIASTKILCTLKIKIIPLKVKHFSMHIFIFCILK